MTTISYAIKSKNKQNLPAVASLPDFSLGEGQEIDPSEVVTNPLISLYCLDDENRQAVFVQLPADVALTKAPFIYLAQYEHAQRVFTVPYETFIEIGDTQPDVQRPIMIYMTGRSGSTLLSHILNESGTAVGLSEPDVTTQFAHFWTGPDDARAEELRRLARSTVVFLFKAYPTDDGKAHAIKMRSEGTRVMDLFKAALPDVRNLFCYRDVLGWATSFNRIFDKLGFPAFPSVSEIIRNGESMAQMDWSYLTAYLDPDQEIMSNPERLAIWWIFNMDLYLAQIERGMPVLALTYDDLVERPEETLRAVFDYCGLPLDRVKQGMRALERDSQSGTPVARENPNESNKLMLTEEQIASVKRIVRRHPILNSLGYVPPRTIQI